MTQIFREKEGEKSLHEMHHLDNLNIKIPNHIKKPSNTTKSFSSTLTQRFLSLSSQSYALVSCPRRKYLACLEAANLLNVQGNCTFLTVLKIWLFPFKQLKYGMRNLPVGINTSKIWAYTREYPAECLLPQESIEKISGKLVPSKWISAMCLLCAGWICLSFETINSMYLEWLELRQTTLS